MDYCVKPQNVSAQSLWISGMLITGQKIPWRIPRLFFYTCPYTCESLSGLNTNQHANHTITLEAMPLILMTDTCWSDLLCLVQRAGRWVPTLARTEPVRTTFLF